jgi:hypothetical protein
MQSENEWEVQDMATSQTGKAFNGPAKTALAASRSPNGAPNQITTAHNGQLVLASIDDHWRYAQMVVSSGLAPKSFSRPEQVLIAVQMGAEIGLTPMQSLANIAVINGRAALWGDALIALVRRSSLCKSLGQPRYEGQGESRVCIVKAVRSNGDTAEGRFGYADAKRAGLLTRDTYKSYADRMYWRRAVGHVVHELFPDLLMGLAVAEDIQDVAYGELIEPELQSGDDAPLNSLDDAAELIAADEPRPSDPTPEELADMKREQETERRAHGDKLFETADNIPF